MTRVRILTGVIICLLIIASGFIFAGKIGHAQSSDSDTDMSRKLDDILNNQKAIIEGIELLKSELDIVKIRVTQQQ
jgi:hypothetical protein